MAETKKLYRSRSDSIIAGVAGGLGEYFEIDSLIVRIIFVLLAFAQGIGIIIYLVLLLVVPKSSQNPGSSDPAKQSSDLADKAKEKANNLAREIKEQGWWQHKGNLFGLILVIIGLAILLNNFFPGLWWFSGRLVFPLLLLIIGLYFILRQRGN